MELSMNPHYAVALEGADDLPQREKSSAEARFMKEIERSFGSPEAMLEVYSAWREACDSDASELNAKTSALAVQWPKAFNSAQRAGLKNIGEGDAHFELSMGQRRD
jgi:hypothetical protein